MRQVKRLICFGLLLAVLAGTFAFAAPAETVTEAAQETTYEYSAVPEQTVDLTNVRRSLQAAMNGSESALAELDEGSPEVVMEIADYLIAAGITELDGDAIQFRIVASSKALYAGPDRDYDRVGALPHGTIVTLLGRDGDWMHITNGEYVGWCTSVHVIPFEGNQPDLPSVVVPASVSNQINVPLQTGNGSAPSNTDNSADAPATGGGSDEDLFWLALTIQHEAGSDWLCDEHQLWVGNVVLNRVAHPAFPPTTIRGIVNQPGQYPWARRSWPRSFISERAFANAQRLLNGERFAPENVVFQSQGRQGENVRTFTCQVSGNTHFFDALVR